MEGWCAPLVDRGDVLVQFTTGSLGVADRRLHRDPRFLSGREDHLQEGVQANDITLADGTGNVTLSGTPTFVLAGELYPRLRQRAAVISQSTPPSPPTQALTRLAKER